MSTPVSPQPWEERSFEVSGADVRVKVRGGGEFPVRDLWELLAMQGLRFLAPSFRSGTSAKYLVVGAPLPQDGADDLARLIASEFVELHSKLKALSQPAPDSAEGALMAAEALRAIRLPADPDLYFMRGGCLQVVGWCGEGGNSHTEPYSKNTLFRLAEQVSKRHQARLLQEHWELASRRLDTDEEGRDEFSGLRKSLAEVQDRIAKLTHVTGQAKASTDAVRSELGEAGRSGLRSRLDEILVIVLGFCATLAGVMLLLREGRAGYHTVVVDRLVVGVPREGALAAAIVGGILVAVGLCAPGYILVRSILGRRKGKGKG